MQGLIAKHTVKRRQNVVDTGEKLDCRQIEETNTKVGNRLVELNSLSLWNIDIGKKSTFENNRTIITRLERIGQLH